MKKITFLAVAALLSAPSFASIEQADGHHKQAKQEKHHAFFEKFDANKDGSLSETEWATMKSSMSEKGKQMRAKFFEKADSNGDGAITKEEMRKLKDSHNDKDKERKHQREKKRDGKGMFDKLDKNGDGRITQDEMSFERPNRKALSFDSIDKDGNKLLSKEELKSHWEKARKHRK